MSNRSAFVIPKGVVFNRDTQGLCIEFDQDIIIQSPIGMEIEKLSSKYGDIRIDIPCELNDISAPNGKVYIGKKITVASCTAQSLEAQADLKAQKITLSGSLQTLASLECENLSAEGSLQITGNAHLESVEVKGLARFGADVKLKNASFGSDLSVQGDIVGENISAQGNIRIHGNTRANKLTSDFAKISCDKDVFLKLLRAKNIVLKGKKIDITAIQAYLHASIAEGSLNSDVLVAKKADIHPNAIGKIMIVDVESPLGPHSIKGCLSLEDIRPLLPNPQKFIQQRGILLNPAEAHKENEHTAEETNHLETQAKETSAEEINTPQETPSLEANNRDPQEITNQESAPVEIEEQQSSDEILIEQLPEEINPFQPTDFSSPSQQSFVDELSHIVEQANHATEKNEPTAGSTTEDDISDNSPEALRVSDLYGMQDPFDGYSEEQEGKALIVIPVTPTTEVSLDSEDDLSDEVSDDMMPVGNINIPPSLEKLYSQLKIQSDAIALDYGEDIPSSLEMMADLIEAKDFSQLREEIKLIWSQVLRFHQKRNTRIPGKVTYAFNEINKLLN